MRVVIYHQVVIAFDHRSRVGSVAAGDVCHVAGHVVVAGPEISGVFRHDAAVQSDAGGAHRDQVVEQVVYGAAGVGGVVCQCRIEN